MAAALYLDSIGRKPLILEKTDKIGGSTAMSGGILWIPNNPLQKAAGVADSLDAGRRYMTAAVGDDAGPGASPARREAFLRAGPQMVGDGGATLSTGASIPGAVTSGDAWLSTGAAGSYPQVAS